ncbi:hypothetical protein LZK73_16730 [Neorhizobium galegae]|nr:hypothetical protein LZK73_16730 [Neorhizobium galegae]
MDTESELLKTACERINDLAEPAFIKDSALIYVAVNAAYARLFGMHPTDFAGNTSRGLAGASDDADRKEKGMPGDRIRHR